MMGLTAKQRELYGFIAGYIAVNGCAPTTSEMMKDMGLQSKSGVVRLLTGLEERGYINRLRNRARAIELVNPAPSVTLNAEILTLTDRYAAEHGLSRDTAANELIRTALQAT